MYAVVKSNMKSDKQARLLGRTRMEYLIPYPREKVKEHLLQLIAVSSKLEKGVAGFNGFEILSTQKIYKNFIFSTSIFTCKCKLIEADECTMIRVDVGTYTYMELSLVLMFLIFSLAVLIDVLGIRDHYSYRGAENFEIGVLLGFIVIGVAAYRNYYNKQEGISRIEVLLAQLKNRLAELEL